MADFISDSYFLMYSGDGGLFPTADEIAAAPFLDAWSIDGHPFFGDRVYGVVTGHRYVADGNIMTSPPRHADLDRGWLRTENTLYRLGTHRDLMGARHV